jgi:flavin reductase (DIM6/NTAB) family NADH-FMN oxidoreductase RutF
VLDPDLFRSVLGRFPSGVTVVTARDAAGEDHGMTVSAFCSVSLVPPLVSICVERSSVLHDVLAKATHFAASVLAGDQEPLSRRFAEPDEGRFDGIAVTRGLSGCVVIGGAIASVECAIRDRHPAGDHTIIVGEVVAATARDARPLLYYRGGYAQLER